jgi:hypothetical protein
MFWQIFRGLSLGFAFSAMIDVLVPEDTVARLLPDHGLLRDASPAKALTLPLRAATLEPLLATAQVPPR